MLNLEKINSYNKLSLELKQRILPFLDVALSTGVFNNIDLEGLISILINYYEQPDVDYSILKKIKEKNLIGFIIYGRAPLTEFGWEIYWLAVHKSHQKNGMGKELVENVQNIISKTQNKFIFRIETSSDQKYNGTRQVYNKLGFIESGHIPHFFDKNNDLIILSKSINLDN